MTQKNVSFEIGQAPVELVANSTTTVIKSESSSVLAVLANEINARFAHKASSVGGMLVVDTKLLADDTNERIKKSGNATHLEALCTEMAAKYPDAASIGKAVEGIPVVESPATIRVKPKDSSFGGREHAPLKEAEAIATFVKGHLKDVGSPMDEQHHDGLVDAILAGRGQVRG